MKNSETLKFHVGADISKSTFDAAIGCIDYNQNSKHIASAVFKNNYDGFNELLKWVHKKTQANIPIGYSIEATGVYYERLAHYLHDNDCTVHVLVPSLARKYMESLGIKTKTDKIDAKSLMFMGLERNLKKWIAPDKFFAELRVLTRERESLIKDRTQLLNKKHALKSGFYVNKTTLERLDKQIDQINEHLGAVETEIIHIIKKNESINNKVRNLLTIQGVGIFTVATVLAETQGFNLIANMRQLTSYAGYDVVLRDSGQVKSKGKISKKGNRHIRRAMHFPALTAIRFNEQYKKFYDRIYNKKSIKMVGYVALQRKLLCLMFTLWKKDEEYKEIVNSGNHELEASFGSFKNKKVEQLI